MPTLGAKKWCKTCWSPGYLIRIFWLIWVQSVILWQSHCALRVMRTTAYLMALMEVCGKLITGLGPKEEYQVTCFGFLGWYVSCYVFLMHCFDFSRSYNDFSFQKVHLMRLYCKHHFFYQKLTGSNIRAFVFFIVVKHFWSICYCKIWQKGPFASFRKTA